MFAGIRRTVRSAIVRNAYDLPLLVADIVFFQRPPSVEDSFKQHNSSSRTRFLSDLRRGLELPKSMEQPKTAISNFHTSALTLSLTPSVLTFVQCVLLAVFQYKFLLFILIWFIFTLESWSILACILCSQHNLPTFHTFAGSLLQNFNFNLLFN